MEFEKTIILEGLSFLRADAVREYLATHVHDANIVKFTMEQSPADPQKYGVFVEVQEKWTKEYYNQVERCRDLALAFTQGMSKAVLLVTCI